MKRVLKWIGASVLVLLVIGYFALIRGYNVSPECHFDLDAAKLHAAATSLGAGPSEIRVEHVTTFKGFPRALVTSGEPFATTEMPVYSYQLVYPDRTIIIDTAMTKNQADKNHGSDYDDAAWSRLHAAIGKASAVYVTHEHADHLGGVAAQFGSPTVLQHVFLNAAQFNPATVSPVEIPADARAQIKTIDVNGVVPVAPGVALIAAPGHTPGSQLVYVVKADGSDLLLTGDTAWQMANIERERGPARLIGLAMKSDLNAVTCQLKAIHHLPPTVTVVPGHDGAHMRDLLARSVLVSGFKN